VGLAANATEIGVARVEHNTSCDGVRFDRYRPDLSLVAESACFPPCDANWVALAPTPSGWLLAIAGTFHIDLVPLDPQGNQTGPVHTIEDGVTPVLAPRGSGGTVTGGPLLLWTSTSGAEVFAVLLGDDGSEEHPAVLAFSSTEADQPGSAVFTGDGFLLAAYERILPGPWFSGAVVRRYWLDGSLGVEHRPAPCWDSAYPQLAWTGTEARLAIAGGPPGGGSEYWVRLSASGEALDSPRPITSPPPPMAFSRSPVAMLGDDMVVLMAQPDMLEAVHVAKDGTPGSPTVLSPASGFASVGLQQLAIVGNSAYAAWLAPASSVGVEDFAGWVGRVVLVQVP
jgi:hypothetical protein